MILRDLQPSIADMVCPVLLLSIIAATTLAEDCVRRTSHDCDGSTSGEGCRPPCCLCCPACGSEKVCRTYVSIEKTQKQCWDVECKEICVPAIRFPWESRGCTELCDGFRCLGNKCGRVRTVRILKQKEYETDECRYEHRIECANRCCQRQSCGHTSGCVSCNDCGALITLTPSPPSGSTSRPPVPEADK